MGLGVRVGVVVGVNVGSGVGDGVDVVLTVAVAGLIAAATAVATGVELNSGGRTVARLLLHAASTNSKATAKLAEQALTYRL